MAYARRSRQEGEGSGGVFLVKPCALFRDFPCVLSFLTDTKFEDGSEREPGTILMCFGEGRFRVWVNDRAEASAAWVSAETLSGALQAADMGLLEGTLEWRPVGKPRRK